METQNPTSEASAVSEPIAESATSSTQTKTPAEPTSVGPSTVALTPTEPKPSYVKLAMRNMVRKRGLSLKHFALTTIGLLAALIGLSYLTR